MRYAYLVFYFGNLVGVFNSLEAAKNYIHTERVGETNCWYIENWEINTSYRSTVMLSEGEVM